MTYDCFSFFNELDILEIRLNTLDSVVDKFVIAESHYTHTGKPKPLYYKDNETRFSKFKDKILHVVVDDFPSFQRSTDNEMSWIRENWQRNAIMRAIQTNANRNDYLIISDVDEIPSIEAVKQATSHNGLSRLHLRMFYYFVNYRNYTCPNWTIGPQVCPIGMLQSTINVELPEKFVDHRINKGITPTVIRFLKSDNIIKNAGWHFSYCGGITAIRDKLKAIAHTENCTQENTDYAHIEKRIKDGLPPFAGSSRFFAIPLDNTFPQYIRDNRQKFSQLIFKITPYYLAKTAPLRLFTTTKRILIEILRAILPRTIKDWLYFTFIEPTAQHNQQ